MGKKSSPPSSPDYSGIASASQENAELSAAIALEQLDFARQQFAEQKETLNQILDTVLPAMEDQAEMAKVDREYYDETWKPLEQDYIDSVKKIAESETPDQLAEANLEIMNKNIAIADEYRERYRTEFQPLEDALVAEAKEFDQPWRQDQEAAKRIADVDFQFEAQRENALRNLESYGVDPSQTRHQALDVGVRTAEAAAKAGAAAMGRQSVTDQARALRSEAISLGLQMDPRAAAAEQQATAAGAGAAAAEAIPIGYLQDLVSMGRGIPAMSAQGYMGAVNAANSGMGASANTMNTMGYMGNPTAWMGQSNQGYGNAINAMNAGYNADYQRWQGRQAASGDAWSGIGTLTGTAMGTDWFGPAMKHVLGFSEGGKVPDFGTDPTDKADNIPVNLSENEYVIPADVVKRKGTEFFDKQIAKTREEIKGAKQGDGQGNYAQGGAVMNSPQLQQRLAQLRDPQYMQNVRQRLGVAGINPAPQNWNPQQEMNQLAAIDFRNRQRYRRGDIEHGSGGDKLPDPGMGAGLNPKQAQRAIDLYYGTARAPGDRVTPELRSRIDALRKKYGFGPSTRPSERKPSQMAISMSRGRKARYVDPADRWMLNRPGGKGAIDPGDRRIPTQRRITRNTGGAR